MSCDVEWHVKKQALSSSHVDQDIYFGDSKAAKRLRGYCSMANLSRHAAILPGHPCCCQRQAFTLLSQVPRSTRSPSGANTSRGDMGDRRIVPVVKELAGLGKQMGVLAITVQRRWMQDNAARGSLGDRSLALSQGWFWKILMIGCGVVSQVRAWESGVG